MANEISVSSVLAVNNGQLRVNLHSGSIQIDQALAKGPTPGYVLVGTDATAIDLSELTTLGVIQIQNLDLTNFVDFGPDDGLESESESECESESESEPCSGSFLPAVRIGPREVWQFRLVPGVSYFARADTAAVGCVFSAFNN